MKRINLPYILAFPLVLSLIAIGFYVYTYDRTTAAIWMVIPFVGLSLLYMFSPQINWFWWNRHTPNLDPRILKLLGHFEPYNNLDFQKQALFRKRLFLYPEAKEYIRKPEGEVPDDLKYAIAFSPVLMTLNFENFILDGHDRIVLYQHQFHSPTHQTSWHHSEYYPEDKVLIFSSDPILNSIINPQDYFNVVIYEYAKILREQYPQKTFPRLSEADWDKLSMIGGFNKEQLDAFIGIPADDVAAVSIHHYFVYPQKFKVIWLDLYNHYQNLFEHE